MKGFGLKVTPKDRRVFIVQFWSPTASNVKRRITLGAYGVLTVDQARAAALAVLGSVASGEDPAAGAGAQKAANRDANVATVSAEYLAEVEAKLKPRTADEYRRLFKAYIVPAIGKKAVNAVEAKDVSAIHMAHKDQPYQANRILQLLKTFLYWSELRGYRPAGANPCRHVMKFPERSSERFLTIEEVGRLGAALDVAERVGLPPAPKHRKHPRTAATKKHRPKAADTPFPANPFAVAVVRFLLLTGWREQEALTLRWSALDFERGFATLEDTKTGKSHRPVGAPALALLSELPRLEGSAFVFPGARADRPLREIRRLWYAARHAAGLDDVRLHDLRHTVASFAVASGHSLYLTGKLLGHARPETTQRYAHLADDARRVTADSVLTSIAAALRPPSVDATSNANRKRSSGPALLKKSLEGARPPLGSLRQKD